MIEEKNIIDFDALRLSLASPAQIHAWSFGEVTKPETINYRTQKPEKDGLFCERIFGPSKDWECYCGKYKKIRYKGIVCDKCGVEVTRAVVRRERMGHINLASPCSHIWFLRGVPSKIGLILDLSPQSLEKVLYFADFIITHVDEDLKKQILEQIREEFKNKKKKIENDFSRQLNLIKTRLGQEKTEEKSEKTQSAREKEIASFEDARNEKFKELEQILHFAEQELKDLKPLKIISEHVYQELSLKYGHIFEANIGGEAIHSLLEKIDLPKLVAGLEQELKDNFTPQRDKIQKRLRLAKNLLKNNLRPEWMILTTVPVIPPDLRPMVPLDGGRFATSDLNDLYRRIINRNNRLKQLQELNAPEVITRNEKRMLQEALDALIDNSARHGKTVVASTGQKRMLKSLADILKGKQGRFRQNLLGKRIDYSGRSVIVVGPKLKLHQCGLPKRMALELFKPFVISQLIKREYVHNVRSANRFIESNRTEVWDILEEIVKDAHVLLNRAPTLHRLGIQAFKPVLIEGKAIQVHPMVCEAFNADFDGDQMAVHVPLTERAKWEAANLMLASKNLLKPATGEPVAKPTHDITWGCYYMTTMRQDGQGLIKIFSDPAEAILAYNLKHIGIQQKIKVRADNWLEKKNKAAGIKDKIIETSVGRILFNQVLPNDYPYINAMMDNKSLRQLISEFLEKYEGPQVADLLDEIKLLGLRNLTLSGYSWGMDDLPKNEKKIDNIKQGEKEVEEVEDQYGMGLLTDSERHAKIIEIWMGVKEKIVKLSQNTLDPYGPVYTMVESGARGSWSQLIQIIGMKGLVTNPAGDIIELPVKGNFKEGFDVLEYFISTHGARKGLSDTALRTANAGYLTRRLVDVSQDMVIAEIDCGDTAGTIITKKSSEAIGLNLIDRVKGRFIAEKIVDPKTKKILIEKDEIINSEKVALLKTLDLAEIKVRSLLSCQSKRGTCQRCYGWDLSANKPAQIGTAVGIMAAQSIGEPGTQLTMRTFHTGGVAGLDITQGLPRVEEIFEARPPKNRAFISEVDGLVKLEEIKREAANINRFRTVKIIHESLEQDLYPLAQGGKKEKARAKPAVKDNQRVKKGKLLFLDEAGEKVLAKRDGLAKLDKDKITVLVKEQKVQDYQISPEFHLLVKDGDLVVKGDPLTNGSLDLKQLYTLKGKDAVQRYIVDEIQSIYASQGQKLDSRHIELIVKQMFSRVLVKSPGDTELLASQRLEKSELDEANAQIKKKNGAEAVGEELLLGVSKVSLSTSSFLSAASFQETSRVLINAAVEGKIDYLRGLKENVIIGRLIPAGTGFKPEAEPQKETSDKKQETSDK
ncbi:MAG: DNA-directed RNA polymerase subunit beta' [Candidatus Buchananbacteria bacterium RIFCSPHIGHO2_01_FULL_46_12]|uniref:DNA-directed RNA polymerase subunit beta' n=4 Tax=Candidatus Buchananiibacteriota TaxID=1817903 RepID=A0A1G1Y566_9BACT|nr:MAG: DNA-directed RNA polymerase subunit beta' [Candidatus Buchananbacteria bacterium RIFCSPHIGHO2_01_FULL_46_12]OGY52882.1 MAG: DNA-directed RNA polymerase subunit beta' [Candidatus Buchananbacteria bacterium RIFCSPLOWO2_01_FULL_45_31]OGY57591.1 MAG: DNA-directed RNA polymerase subunit beta' [Candidatus Buchananbacteria bacterium RIFCSPLOWO2_02_FULL_46_11b]